jgi:hypothetical protein
MAFMALLDKTQNEDKGQLAVVGTKRNPKTKEKINKKINPKL